MRPGYQTFFITSFLKYCQQTFQKTLWFFNYMFLLSNVLLCKQIRICPRWKTFPDHYFNCTPGRSKALKTSDFLWQKIKLPLFPLWCTHYFDALLKTSWVWLFFSFLFLLKEDAFFSLNGWPNINPKSIKKNVLPKLLTGNLLKNLFKVVSEHLRVGLIWVRS